MLHKKGSDFMNEPLLRGCEKAEVVTVIKTISLYGEGTSEEPFRYLFQYLDFDGNLLASHDSIQDVK